MQAEILPPQLLENVQRVTLLWIGRLGDLIVSTPVIGSIRNRFPNARIILIIGSKGETAARLIPGLDSIVALPAAWNIPALLRFLWALRNPSSDVLIDLNSSESKTSALLSRFAPARVKLTFDKKRFNSCYTHFLPAPEERERMLDRYGRLARALGAVYDPTLRIRLDPKDIHRAQKILGKLDSSSPHPYPLQGERVRWIAIHPGNFKKFDNRWPEEKFVELTNRILELPNFKIIFLTGPGEEAAVAKIVQHLRRRVPVLPPLPVGTTAAILSSMDLFLGNCTGTTHLAIAAGTPTFTILAGYTKTVWMPKSGPHFDVTSDSWTSCRDIPVEKVWKRLSDVLKTLRRPGVSRQ